MILDGTLLRIDRVGMGSGRDRPYYSGKHKAHGVNVQVIADPAGRLIWASPALPGARHDMGAAREHGILDALTAAGVRVIADNGYRGAGFEVPQRRRPATPRPGSAGGCRTTRRRSTPPTPANADPVSARTPSSRAGRSSARSAAAHAGPPTSSRPSWSSSSLAEPSGKGSVSAALYVAGVGHLLARAGGAKVDEAFPRSVVAQTVTIVDRPPV